MDALDAALSIETVDPGAVETVDPGAVETVDPGAVETLATEVDAACTACHVVYREQDPVTREYRLRQSALQ
jgi:hypothetical protein